MDYSQHKQLEFRRKFWKLVGAEISVTDPATEQLVGLIKMKAWKLREDIRLYSDRSMSQELIRIGARNIIDFGATYDVFDSPTNQQLFSMRRKGLKSTFVRDHWDISDVNGTIFGSVQETSSGLALARRWLEILPYGEIIGLVFSFVPQTYIISVNNATVGTVLHRKNPFIVKMALDTSAAPADADLRISFASVALLSVIDATKNN